MKKKEINIMKITEVKINQVKGESTLKAFANITIDDEFVVKGFKVIEGKKGLFVGCPSSKGADDTYYDDAFPITAEAREYLSDMILDAYDADFKKNTKTPRKRR